MKQKIADTIRTFAITGFATIITSTAVCTGLKQFNDPYVMPREFASATWDSTKVQGIEDVYRDYVVQQFNLGEEHLPWNGYISAVLEKNHLETERQLEGKILLPNFKAGRGN